MSGIFDEGQTPPARPARRPPSRRPRALVPTLAVVVLLVILFSIFVEVWTGRLWFVSLGYGGVFTTILWTRVGLFVIFGLVLAAVAVGNALLAFRMRPILIGDGYRNPTVERYQDTIDPIRHWVLIGLGLVMFLFGGASASGEWKTYLLWRNGEPFGQDDVFFHRDIGFFVFGYPWYRFLITFGFTTLVIGLLVAGATHYLYGGIRLQARRDKIASGAQVQLSVLLGVFMLVKAVSYWLDRYGLAISDGSLLTGITYTDEHALLPAKNILAIIAVICALLFFINVVRPGWMLPVLGFGLLILSAVLIGGIWPAIVQRFQVKPSEADKETSYIARNIEATRVAYNIDPNTVKIRNYPGTTTDTPTQLQDKAAKLPGVRLIDPQLVAPAFEQLQQQRGFYKMPDVLDVDRYTFSGDSRPQDVVIAARELNIDGVPPDQRNWTNDHTVYTHGYGVVAAFGDQRSPSGEPVWAEQNLPSTGKLPQFKQEIYYGQTEPDYSIVGAPAGATPVELNIPDVGGNDTTAQNSTYTGAGGVPIGSMANQLLYAAKFWDSSILLSGRVNSESKVIYDRDPRLMAEKVAPWLSIDGDPYPAVVGGRLVWIMDGFTTTADYPMSDLVNVADVTNDSLTARQAVAGQTADNINYIRNSVKITVDAYDGTVSLYQWDTQDPILQAWMKAFPGVVKPKTDITPDLLAHLRYPEDLFKVQRELLSRYHVTQPKTFYGGSENWLVPEDPTQPTSAQPPFYLTVKVPGQRPEFSLTSVYVPQNRANMASFMAVNADATSKNYGQFQVLQLPSDSAVSGPGQIANAMSNDPTVSGELLKYKQNDTLVQMGNLLTLPIGGEMMYVQPVYTLRGGTGSYPILQFVVASVGGGGGDEADRVGIGTSFDQALANALGVTDTGLGTGTGSTTPPPPGSNGTPPPPGNETTTQKLTRYLANAQQSFQDAQAALDQGRLGDYQTLNKEASDWVQRAIDVQAQIDAGGSTDGSPTTPAPTTPAPTTPTATSPSGSATTAPAASATTPTPSNTPAPSSGVPTTPTTTSASSP